MIVYKVYELLYKIDIILNDINAQFPEFETIKSAFKLFYSVDGWVQLMVFRFILFICDLNIDNKIKRFSKYQFKVWSNDLLVIILVISVSTWTYTCKQMLNIYIEKVITCLYISNVFYLFLQLIYCNIFL